MENRVKESLFSLPTEIKKTLCNECKEYDLVRLPNGILTLLISDLKSKMSSASLCVASGSHNDPEGLPGLAHLCEHMLFMGSKKFPRPSDFFELIDNHGGSTNATTGGEQTTFFFEVKNLVAEVIEAESVFEQALEMYSNFFILPRFAELCIYDEIRSIDEEHASNLNDPEKILYHGIRLLSHRLHPFHNFGTGSSRTLLGTDCRVKNALIEYFYTYYIAQNMTLALMGPQSLNHLRKLSMCYFKYLRSTDSNNFSMNILENAFKVRYLRRPLFGLEDMNNLLFIKSMHSSKLRIFFPVTHANENPEFEIFMMVLNSLIGHEGTGTFCNLLVNSEHLASSVLVHKQELTYDTHILVIDVSLLKRGELRIRWVLELLFVFINQVIVKTGSDQLSHYLQNFAAIDKFRYYNKPPFDSANLETSSAAENMQMNLKGIKLENIIKGYKALDDTLSDQKECWIEKTRQFRIFSKNILQVKNLNLVVVGADPSTCKTVTNQELYNKFDINYDLHYFCYKIDTFLFDNLEIKKKFFEIPDLSHLIPLVSRSSLPAVFNSSGDPYLVASFPNAEIWHMGEDNNDHLRASASIMIKLNSIEPKLKNFVSIDLACVYIGTNLREILYDLEFVGFSWCIYSNANGSPSISIYFEGIRANFSGVLELGCVALKSILANTFEWLNRALVLARSKLRKEYEEAIISTGIKRTILGLAIFLEEFTFYPDQKLDALEKLEVKRIQKIVFSEATNYAKVLFSGEYTKQQVLELWNKCDFFSSTYKNGGLYTRWASSIPLLKGANYVIEVGPSENEIGNTVHYYIELGLRDDSLIRSFGILISCWLKVEFSHFMRFRHQVAYSFQSGLRINRGTLGLYLVVLSVNLSTKQIWNHIKNFMVQLEDTLVSMTAEEFRKKVVKPFLEGLNKSVVREESINLLFRSVPLTSSSNFIGNNFHHNSAWEQIITNNYRFSGILGEDEIDEDVLNHLTQQKAVEIYCNKVSERSKGRSTLLILVERKPRQDKLSAKKYDNAALHDEPIITRSSMNWRKLSSEALTTITSLLSKPHKTRSIRRDKMKD